MINVDLDRLISSKKLIYYFLDRCRKDKLSLNPIAVEIHWTSRCNYNCIHCSYGFRRKNFGELPIEITENLVKDLIEMKVQSVYLSGGGEPTVYPKWEKFAEKFLTNGIDVSLITNGVKIEAEETLDIVRMFNYIAVSIYSTEEKEYFFTTSGKNFSTQFDLPGKIKSKAHRCIVGARCVINKINYKNVIKVYEKAIDSGYDYVIFIPVVDYEGAGISLSDEEKKYVYNLIKENLSKIDNKKTNLSSLLSKYVSHYEEKDYRKEMENFNVCDAIEIRSNAFINYDGEVYLCQPHIGKKDYSIGNLNNNSFKKLWNDKRHIEVINKLNKEFKDGLCKNCRSIAFNKEIDKYIRNTKDMLNIDPFV